MAMLGSCINQYFILKYYMIKKNYNQTDRFSQNKNSKKEQERMTSCFSKKNAKVMDATQSKLNTQKHQEFEEKKKSKSPKKKTLKQLKEPKQKTIQASSKEIQNQINQNKSSQQTEQNLIAHQSTGDDCIKQLSELVLKRIQTEKNVEQPYKRQGLRINTENEELVSSCSVQSLLNLNSKRLKDSSFFEKGSIVNPSTRLLILQFQNSQVYINEHGNKSNVQVVKIPENIKDVFKEKKSNFFASPPVRMPTEQTYDTSNPSSYSKFTPCELTPRSNQQGHVAVRERTASFNNQIQSNYIDPVYPTYNQIEYQQYYEAYDEYYEQQKLKNNRKRKTISIEESKAYMIDLKKIESDGRTTIMIRNIPNKYTHDMLIELIHRNNKKKFDFFYLPIDYTNSCNMGYAFINFLHTKFIKQFYKQFNGQKWERFNSQKICSLSYARIQGTISLISHFQNAGVMYQKQKKMRPLIDVDVVFMNNLSTIIEKQKQKQ